MCFYSFHYFTWVRQSSLMIELAQHPLIILVFKMEERHELLRHTIGYLQEEQDALDRGRFLRNLSLVYIVVGSGFETLFFFFYNNWFHPFAKILQDGNH